jgi:hypothetical protein
MNARSTLLLALVTAIALTACSSRSANTSKPSTELSTSSTPPYGTKEPERYQALRTVTSSIQPGQEVKTQTLIARDGPLRHEEYQNGDSPVIIYLDLPEGRLVLSPAEKLYSEVIAGQELSTGPPVDPQIESSAEHLLPSTSSTTSYQRLVAESVNGRTATKYRVVVNDVSSGTVRSTETFIWIDETLGMPIKSETTSPNGARSTMELFDVRLDVDRSLFRVPEGYRKVDIVELQRRLLR